MATPPLPPGFVLEPAAAPAAASRAVPPPPPGFELEDIPTLGTVQALPPDFSEVTSSVDSTADGRQADGWRAGPLRDAAFSARSVLQGAGSLLGALGGDAFNNYVVNPVARAVGAQEARPYRDELGALADTLGLPKAQTSGDRVLGDIGEALTGTGLTLGAGGALGASRAVAPTLARAAPAPQLAPTLGERAAEVLTAQPILQTVSAATGAGASSMARESGAGVLGQTAAGVLGGLAPASITAGVPATLRGAVRGGESSRMRLQNSLEDFAVLGSTPTIGQGTGTWSRQGMETMLGAGPTSAGVIARAAERQADEIGSGLKGMAERLSPNASADEAGKAIGKGVETFAKNVKATRKAFYWQVDRHVPDATPVDLASTSRALDSLTTVNPGAAATTADMVSDRMVRLKDTIAQDLASAQANGVSGLPYSAIKDIRTQIGNEAFDFTLTPDKDTAKLRQLYGALTADMERAARAQGPQAVAAIKRANRFYKWSNDRLELLERVVDKNGGPNAVFNASLQGTKDGSSTLRAVMNSLPEDGQKAVSAAVLKRIGLKNDLDNETFNAATFLSNWNDRISPEAKQILFRRYGPEFTADMDKLARAARSIKEGSKALAAPSGTPKQGAQFAFWGGLLGSLFSGNLGMATLIGAGGSGANILARSMTNPRIVKWMARNTETPVGALPAQINVLKRMGSENDDQDAIDLAQALSEQLNQSPDQQEGQ